MSMSVYNQWSVTPMTSDQCSDEWFGAWRSSIAAIEASRKAVTSWHESQVSTIALKACCCDCDLHRYFTTRTFVLCPFQWLPHNLCACVPCFCVCNVEVYVDSVEFKALPLLTHSEAQVSNNGSGCCRSSGPSLGPAQQHHAQTLHSTWPNAGVWQSQFALGTSNI